MCEELQISVIEVWDDAFLSDPKLIERELYQAVMGGV